MRMIVSSSARQDGRSSSMEIADETKSFAGVSRVFIRFLNVRSNSYSRLTMMVNVSEDRRGSSSSP